MKAINKISDDLIEIIEYAKPNACFQTNEYPDYYDFVVFKETINPFDLFNDNKVKDKEIERLNKELELQKLKLEDTRKELVEQDKYIDKLKIEYDKKLAFERQIKKEAREYITKQVHRNQQFYEMDIENILEILDKVGETDDSTRDV